DVTMVFSRITHSSYYFIFILPKEGDNVTAAADITVWLALGAGVLSFLNPCTLPIFPAYLSYITGVSVKELEDNESSQIRRKLLIHSVFFLIGVSLIFISLGVG